MAEQREGDGRGFKVHDRRRFSDTGEPRGADDSAPPDSERQATAASGTHAAEASASAQRAADHAAADAYAGAHGNTGGAAGSGPEINFPTFIISLSTQALAHLGEIPDPVAGSPTVDLVGARQLIDILAMLKEKTRGNLAEDEAALLDHALYDLRMRYVERAHQR